jgi:3-dehydroquinate synthase
MHRKINKNAGINSIKSKALICEGMSTLYFEDIMLWKTQLKSLNHSAYVFFIDEQVQLLQAQTINELSTGLNAKVLQISKPESSKNLSSLHLLLEKLDLNLDKKAAFIGVGGGAVLDLVGFLGSIYKRGIATHYVPSTLLAQVDAAIGGKTALNVQGTKNVLGSFYMPQTILSLDSLLTTLPIIEQLGGYAEMLKHAIIKPEIGLESFLSHSNWGSLKLEVLNTEAIGKSQEIKKSIVAQDFKEQNVRKFLNLGHTIGHTIEASYNYALNHGIAIAAGIWIELELSYMMGLLNKEHKNAIQKHIQAIFPKVELHLEAIIHLVQHDKKNANGKILGIGIKTPGNLAYDVEYKPELIQEACKSYLKHA